MFSQYNIPADTGTFTHLMSDSNYLKDTVALHYLFKYYELHHMYMNTATFMKPGVAYSCTVSVHIGNSV